MADRVTVSVDLHGTEEALLQAGPKIAKRLFRRALKSVGEVWKTALRGKVPVDSGDLRESIDYIVKLSPKQDSGTVTVGPTYDGTAMKTSQSTTESPGVYGMFVEFGLQVKKYVFHPFMRPTFDATAEAVIKVFADGLREDLEDALK